MNTAYVPTRGTALVNARFFASGDQAEELAKWMESTCAGRKIPLNNCVGGEGVIIFSHKDHNGPALLEFHRLIRPGGWIVIDASGFVNVLEKERFEERYEPDQQLPSASTT